MWKTPQLRCVILSSHANTEDLLASTNKSVASSVESEGVCVELGSAGETVVRNTPSEGSISNFLASEYISTANPVIVSSLETLSWIIHWPLNGVVSISLEDVSFGNCHAHTNSDVEEDKDDPPDDTHNSDGDGQGGTRSKCDRNDRKKKRHPDLNLSP